MAEAGEGPLITVYGRDGCHLCDDAIAAVRALDPSFGVRLRIIDIETDDDLLSRYLERIPVVAHGTEEWFEFEVDPVRLEEHVRRVASIGPRDDDR